jgi:glycosyltransferase involved in cell wall biosynthesis
VIYADQRWIGPHGIGSFARHVLASFEYCPIPLATNPAAPLDSWRLMRALSRLESNDLFFSPGYNTPLSCPCPFVFVIHDLSHIFCRENTSLAIQLYYAKIMKRACHRSDAILTVSEFTRAQIVEWSRVSSEKVFNVGCGVDPAYRPEGDSYNFAFQYLLCVSNRKPHKNEFRLVEAFGKARLDPGIHLVLTGKPTEELSRCIERQRLTARIDFIGLVPNEKLPSLYRGALALVFPSLWEGFGLPPLEAMACGIPVVTSNIAAMPEVAGDAAILVDPTSIEQISNAMERVVGDSHLRRQLRERGLARAAQFPWSKTVTMVHEVLRAKARTCFHVSVIM